MALNDLIWNKFTRIIGTLAALAVPYAVGCEGDTTNNTYEGSGNGGGDHYATCQSACEYSREVSHCGGWDEDNDMQQCLKGCEKHTSSPSGRKAYFNCIFDTCESEDCTGTYN
jgi:hypothetical protein